MSKITFTEDINSTLNNWINKRSYSKIAVIVDENTLRYCYPLFKFETEHTLVKIISGEKEKNLATCELIWNELTRAKFDRKSLVINLGGGVIGDMGGFCAATYKRGIDFIQIPTTLLAQVDASVGGKLGIDYHDFKNHIGVFREPAEVLISTQFLKTLPSNQLKSGFAEVIKHALISDRSLWGHLKSNTFPEYNWNEIIKQSVTLKQQVVEEDPYEQGLRKILNFGHTVGHAIESLRLHGSETLLHGEAIAHGMIVESIIAYEKQLLSKESLHSIAGFISSIYGKIEVSNQEITGIVENVLQDKKNKGDRVLMALIDDIGHAQWDIEIDSDEIIQAIHRYHSI